MNEKKSTAALTNDENINFPGAADRPAGAGAETGLSVGTQRAEIYRCIIDGIPAPILVHDEHGRFIMANRAFNETFKISEERLYRNEFAADEFAGLETINGASFGIDAIDGCAKNVFRHVTGEFGTVSWYEVVRKHVEIFPGFKAVLCMMTDITAHKQTEDRLAKSLQVETDSNLFKNHLINAISHDFKGPLTIILSSAEMVEVFHEGPADNVRDEYMHKIKNSVQKMDSMLENLLALNKVENQKIELQCGPIAIRAFCEGLIDEIKTIYKKCGKITLDIRSNTNFQAVADEKILRHVLINILSNAVKYSDDDYRVDFEVDVLDESIEFTVTDHGAGIKSDEIPDLFNAFYRTESTCRIPGNGLGLTIAKKFTELHGGTITVRSSPNAGAAFIISIPLKAAHGRKENYD